MSDLSKKKAFLKRKNKNIEKFYNSSCLEKIPTFSKRCLNNIPIINDNNIIQINKKLIFNVSELETNEDLKKCLNDRKRECKSIIKVDKRFMITNIDNCKQQKSHFLLAQKCID